MKTERKTIVPIAIACVLGANIAFGACCGDAKPCEKYRPRLFKQFGEVVNLPDGLTQDKEGNIFMSAPNLVNKDYAGVVMKRCVKNGKWSVFCAGQISPKTGRGCPMGIEMGPDGNLYYCDNQYFLSKDYASRVMKVVIDPVTKEAVSIVPVVENVKLANAIRFHGNEMFITDTFFDLPGEEGIGGVYRIKMSDFANSPVKLLEKSKYKDDPYFIAETRTKPLEGRGGDNSGADGLCITESGDIFFGTFGSGRFYTAKRNADGSYATPELLMDDPAKFPCCDGICYDPAKKRVIMTDSASNAIHVWDVAGRKFGTLWRNCDNDGSTGLLDQPCEPMIWQGKLLIVNFDMPFPGLKNSKHDKFHTVSIMDL
jgi:hypothetical protein